MGLQGSWAGAPSWAHTSWTWVPGPGASTGEEKRGQGEGREPGDLGVEKEPEEDQGFCPFPADGGPGERLWG